MPTAKRTRYTKQFKAAAVLLSRSPDIAVEAVAHQLEIHPIQLTNWRREYALLTDAQLLEIAKDPDKLPR